MLDKLEAIKAKFDQLGVALTNPEIVSNNKKFSAMSKEYRSLGKIVTVRNAYVKLIEDIEFNKEVLYSDDEEMREMAKAALPSMEQEKETLEKEIRNMLIPKDPFDEKNAILEIRAGTGGDEASLFAGNLLRMYLKYCEKKGWKSCLLNSQLPIYKMSSR
jgi:peptide chain release factor 1